MSAVLQFLYSSRLQLRLFARLPLLLSACQVAIGVYCYSPHGEELRLFHGTTVFTNHAYNSRLQPSQFIARTSTSTQFSLSFNFNLGVNDNGTLARIVNNATPGQSRTYTYDQLNRIVSAANDSTAGDTSNWGNVYAIDAWGNLYQKNPCNGTVCPTKTFSDSLTVSVSNNKNQFDAYAYDANGNLTNDQLGHTFTYDAENRPTSGGGANYYYDGEGERVAKSNGTLYWFGTNSAPVLETDLTGLAVNEYIFANGQRWAMRHNGSFFYLTDQVGSAQVVVADSGSLQQAIEYHPYGEERVISNFLGNNYRFTGKEHDSETNDDYFGARYYGSWSARFLTPDWAATPVPIPYAQLASPQTLNLYSYVENNPITGTDPDGHDPDGSGTTRCAAGSSACNGSQQVKEDSKLAQTAKEMADRVWGTMVAGGEFALGVGKGVGASLAFGTVDIWNPSPNDTLSERAGEAAGTAVVGGLGTDMATGGTTTAIATAPACATGAGCAIPATAAGAAVVGTALAQGAAQNAAALISTPIQMSSRVGDFTRGDKNKIDAANAEKNGGRNACDKCGRDLQKIANKKGEPTPANQLQRHHDPAIEAGGGRHSDAKVFCPECHKEEHQ